MSKKVQDIQTATIKTEKDLARKKQARREKKKIEEDLSQQWVAPILVSITLLIGYLVYMIYN